MTMDNSFEPSQASFEGTALSADTFVLQGHTVPAENGLQWLTSAWELFKKDPGVWIGIMLIYLIIMAILAFIPLLGSVATSVLTPVFMAGLILGSRALDRGEKLAVNHLFAGFSDKAGPLLLVGLFYLVGVVVVTLIAAIISGGLAVILWIISGGSSNEQMFLLALVFFVMIVLLLMFPLIMALWFAPALVMMHDIPPLEAMKASFMVMLRNILPFLLYSLILFVLAIVASIPLFLGWFVLGPVMLITMYTAYRDLFFQN